MYESLDPASISKLWHVPEITFGQDIASPKSHAALLVTNFWTFPDDNRLVTLGEESSIPFRVYNSSGSEGWNDSDPNSS